MNVPQWRMYRVSEERQPAPPVYVPPVYVPPASPIPQPPQEQPGLLQRVWNGTKEFIQSIPSRIRSIADWASHQWDNLRNRLTIGGNNTTVAGVDKRLLHVACAMGVGAHSNCTCTDGARPSGAPYGARNSEHIRGNALDLSLRTVPGRTEKEKEQYVADVATVLGYGGRNESDRIYASVHNGTARHLHFQFGANNISGLNPAASSRGGQADLAAAQQRISRLVGPEGLERIMQTRAPDGLTHNGTPLANSYTGYRQPQPAQAPQLVYSQGRPHQQEQAAPRPRPTQQQQHPEQRWQMHSIGS